MERVTSTVRTIERDQAQEGEAEDQQRAGRRLAGRGVGLRVELGATPSRNSLMVVLSCRAPAAPARGTRCASRRGPRRRDALLAGERQRLVVGRDVGLASLDERRRTAPGSRARASPRRASRVVEALADLALQALDRGRLGVLLRQVAVVHVQVVHDVAADCLHAPLDARDVLHRRPRRPRRAPAAVEPRLRIDQMPTAATTTSASASTAKTPNSLLRTEPVSRSRIPPTSIVRPNVRPGGPGRDGTIGCTGT